MVALNPKPRKNLRNGSMNNNQKSQRTCSKTIKNDENLIKCSNTKKQRKSPSPSRMVNKLKEQNILYSNLFDMRMRRNSCKIVRDFKQENNSSPYTSFNELSNELCNDLSNQKTFIFDSIVEKPEVKERYFIFNFQILMMLIFTIFFSVLKLEMKIVFKFSLFPLRTFLRVNGILASKLGFILTPKKKKNWIF